MCLSYIAVYYSAKKTCMSCIRWCSDDFVCLDKEENARRRRDNELDGLDKLMRSSRTIVGLL